MQAQVLVQPPPFLSLAQQTSSQNNRPRASQPFFFEDLSNLVPSPPNPTLDKDSHYTAQLGSNYSYAARQSFDQTPQSSLNDLYDSASTSHLQDTFTSDNTAQQPNYSLVSQARHPGGISPTTSSTPSVTGREPVTSSRYVSDSPSPVGGHPTTSFPQPYSAPHHQDHFAQSATSYPPDMDRYSIANLTDRYLRGTDKYPHSQQSILDQRRMSEPAMFGSAAGPYSSSVADLASARYHQLQHEYASSYPSSRSYGGFTSSSLHRTLSSGSVRDHHPGSSWKGDQLPLHSYDGVDLEEPISPLNPTFSGGEGSPGMGMHGLPYGSLGDDYGPSPPGTGTSTSSNAPGMHHGIHSSPGGGAGRSDSNSKQYSFVSLPGNAVKKRPRRRYDEIERLYQCSWPDCTKAYGTLNHLNAHVTMQKHGPKRSPNEFKDLRKQWRKAKKEESDARALGMRVSQASRHPQRNSLTDADLQSYRLRPHIQGSTEDLRYQSDELDAQAHQDDVYARRQQRFSAFHSPAARNSSGAGYISSSAPVPQHLSSVALNRLPANSTLLTPLPGYEPPTIAGVSELDGYNPYETYGDDGRPGSGHGSLGGYVDDRRRSSVYTEDGRPRSGHSSLRGAQDQEYRDL